MNVHTIIVLLASLLLEIGYNCESVKHFDNIIETTEQHQTDASANFETIEYVSFEDESLEEIIFEEETVVNETFNSESLDNELLDNKTVDIEMPDGKIFDTKALKIETKMKKKTLKKGTAAGQSKTAKKRTVKSTVEVHP
ncbi:hypothetical protein [Flavobacterium hercynium]|uniref:Uncharacterized protein n=1 Tax=Flavobacterium hercynium TaxID=387094 RepID=A0A226HK17_9FLAO|nr:hypothetical protein [Flavobacterium hercynium]OXA93830.1 hypothetical protein B0A66_06170 [Flavobacterium hercynium]SMP20245.1 hypothetical protein SAMN06265346_106134 [Flavobacterium hercynium]